MQVVDANGNVFGQGLEITGIDGKPKVPVINTDITIGTTVINGGVSGRLLFDDAGVVGETNGIHWNTAGFLGIGTIIPVAPTGYNGITINSTTGAYTWFQAGGVTKYAIGTEGNINYHNLVAGTSFLIRSGGNNYFNLVQSTGNVQIGTTTDAGYKLDVAGDIRTQNAIRILNPAFTNGGSITHSANSTLVVTGGPGGGSENITFGPSNRIFINAGQTWASQTFLIGGQGSVGGIVVPSNFGAIHLITGTSTAASAIARAQYINTTLVQSVANDVLTAVQITPTFTVNNTLFHEAYWMRLTGSYTPASYTGNNNATGIDLSNSFTNTFNAIGIRIRHTYGNVQNGYGILLESAGFIGIAQTSLTSTNFLAGTTVIGSSVVAPAAGYTLHVTNNTNGAIKVGSASQGNEHLIISHSQAGSTFSSIRNTFAATGATMLIDVAGQNNLRLFGTGNVAINNSTDAGFKLDVNGTARFSGQTFIQSAAGAVGLIADFGQTNSRIQFESHGSNDFTQIKIGNNFSLSRNGGSNPSISTTLNFDFKVAQINFSSLGNAPSRIFISGNYGLGSAYFGANNSNGTTVSTLYFQNSVTPLAVQNVIATFNIWGMSDNATVPTTPASSMFALESTTRGFLPPRMTNAQMLAIATPAAGLIVYDTTNNKHYGYDGTTWNPFY